MKSRKALAHRGASPLSVRRWSSGAKLVFADAGTTVLVLRGACELRTGAGALERLEAGSLLLSDSETKPGDRAVLRALSLLQTDSSKAWTVERLARAVGLSRAALARRFVSFCGCSPMRYLTELRLALAASLLHADDASLAEIAARVGYASEFALSRAFKRAHGVSPGVFRKLHARPTPNRSALALAA